MTQVNHIQVHDDLTIAIGTSAVCVSPAEGFRLAEKLIRTAARRALAEEAEVVEAVAQREHRQ